MNIASIKKILVFISLFIYFIIVIVNNENRSSLIQKELDLVINKLKTNYTITTQRYINDSISSNTYISQNKKMINIYTKLKDANATQKKKLRQELYALFKLQYKSLKQRGVLQFHFFLPDNTSFLRMHKPSKYGDDLSLIRYSMKYTNETHKESRGFEQGRVAHGFRNVFPIFDSNQTYLGAYEISYSSASLQYHILKIEQTHSHFLVNKEIFDKNTWNKKLLVLNYKQSIENPNYMHNTSVLHVSKKKLFSMKKELIKPNFEMIQNNMKQSKLFSFYDKIDSSIKIVSFLPIKTIKNDLTAAYLVSYTDSPHIMSIIYNSRLINIISFLLLISIAYLIYRELLAKEKLRIHTQEQAQLLSLFDNGEITLFKWKNNIQWSVEYVSKNVEALTTYKRDAFISNLLPYASIIDPRDIKRVMQEVDNAIKNELDIFTHKPYRIITNDSKTKWVHDITYVIRNQNKEIRHFLGYLINITDLKELEQEVRQLNTNLNTEVIKQTDDNLRKDKLLQEQSKLAAMGEMVGSIAHQWRQPLNSLNINIQNLDDDYEDGMINEIFIENFIEKQTKTIQYMSQTIDDFRNFFRVDKIKKIFTILHAVKATLSIQSTQIKKYNIDIQILGDNFSILQIESEFSQVLLNIISNSIDAIIINKIKNPRITIEINSKEHKITLCDNAGGIEKKIQDRIFEPYFTTKEQGKGVGIGLYMSKTIIERHMNGKLLLSNVCSVQGCTGAIFTINLPKSN